MAKFTECEKRWFLNKLLKHNRQTSSQASLLGTTFHETLSFFYKTGEIRFGDTWHKLTLEERELVAKVMEVYLEKPPLVQAGDEIIICDDTEIISPILHIQGHPDLVFWRHNKRQLIVVDHKTVGYFFPEIPTKQVKAYVAMLWEAFCDESPNMEIRFIFNGIRREFPQPIKISKNGLVSKAKISTTKERFLQALIDNEQTTEGYEEILKNLPSEKDYYVKRIEFNFTQRDILLFRESLQKQTKRMREVEQFRMPIGRDDNLGCRNCQFSFYCSTYYDDISTILFQMNRI